jgi:hypothetical protein
LKFANFAMLDSMRPVLIVILTAVILGGLATLLGRSAPAARAGQIGAIRPELWSAWLTVVGGLAMFVTASWASIHGNGGWAAVGVALLGAAIAGFMAPSVTSIHIVHWNEHGVEGPSKMFGPTLGASRTEIAWSEIVKTGKTITGYWFVESGDGRRVYWSYLYKGYGALIAALQSRRPSLQLRF